MKKITAILIILISLSCITSAQQNQLMDARNSASENLEVFKNTIGDTTLDVLKELTYRQNDLILADRAIIEGYLDSIKTKADTLKHLNTNLTIDKEMLEKENAVSKSLMFYGMIGGGVLFILFILFLVLFLITSGKKKKYRKQVEGVEKMKQANQKEIELAKKEVANMKAVAQKEIMQAKEELNKEAKNMQAKIDTLATEKTNLEKKASDKSFEFAQLQLRFDDMKKDYEKKLSDANNTASGYEREKLLLEKQIFAKGSETDDLRKERDTSRKELADLKSAYEKEKEERRVFEEKLTEVEKEMHTMASPSVNTGEADNLRNENERLRNEISSLNEFKNLYEKELNEKKQLEEKLAEKENELKNIPPANTDAADELRSENDRLREDIEELYKRIDREVAGRNMIEDELRKFIDELKNLR